MGIDSEYALIPLTQGHYAIVDLLDCGRVSKHKWTFSNGYAYRASGGRKNRQTLYMHRLINGTESGEYTDHINLQKLDNRQRNLRRCNAAQNKANVAKVRDGVSSRFKGVSFNKTKGKWLVFVGSEYVGQCTSEIAAARLYNIEAINKYGEFALLNEVK